MIATIVILEKIHDYLDGLTDPNVNLYNLQKGIKINLNYKKHKRILNIINFLTYLIYSVSILKAMVTVWNIEEIDFLCYLVEVVLAVSLVFFNMIFFDNTMQNGRNLEKNFENLLEKINRTYDFKRTITSSCYGCIKIFGMEKNLFIGKEKKNYGVVQGENDNFILLKELMKLVEKDNKILIEMLRNLEVEKPKKSNKIKELLKN